jgi:hypothetical protein
VGYEISPDRCPSGRRCHCCPAGVAGIANPAAEPPSSVSLLRALRPAGPFHRSVPQNPKMRTMKLR